MDYKTFKKGKVIPGLGRITDVYRIQYKRTNYTQYKIDKQYYHEKVIYDYLLERQIMRASFQTLVHFIYYGINTPTGIDADRVRKMSFLLATSSEFRKKVDKYPTRKRNFLTANVSIALGVILENERKP